MSSDSQLSNPSGWDWPFWMKGSMPNPLDFFCGATEFRAAHIARMVR
jgi:hypothetical protein